MMHIHADYRPNVRVKLGTGGLHTLLSKLRLQETQSTH